MAEEYEQHNVTLKRVGGFARLSAPLIISFLMMDFQEQVNIVMVGNLDDSAKLAAIGMGNMMMNTVPYALMLGINTALETLVSQAYGRRNLRDCGLYLHRATFLICCLYVPIALSFCAVESFLVAIGIEE
mmetsp:Transcript_25120/g.31493  ORF Transcript_25120/g.31493 Transcript_25120/m.31493 type:complete len:130 (+) Transcript_25120:399-788(+)